MCVSLDISILIVKSENQAHACRVQAIRNELATIQQKFLSYLMNCLITVCQTMDYPYQQM